MLRLCHFLLRDVPLYTRCVNCQKCVDYCDVFNKKTVHKSPHKVVCKFCLQRCSLCSKPQIRTKKFNASSLLCDNCYVLRKGALENVYFRYPQCRYIEKAEECEKMKEYIQKEAAERDLRRVSNGYMSSDEIKQKYYQRHRHRPM